MMTAAVELLKRDIQDQRGKLEAIQKANAEAIRAGKAAQREVEAQARHVDELTDALALIEGNVRGSQIDAAWPDEPRR